MKRTTLFLVISAALIGCQETLTNTEVQENAESFEAMVEGFEDKTKTSMTDERNIVWSEGDRIAIFQGSNVADKYILKDEAAGTGKGEFTLESDESKVNGDFTSGMEIRTNIALYPYSDELTCTDISIRINDSEELKAYEIENITLPAVQKYVPDSFGNGTFPMVAVTETMDDHKLNFKNVMGAIKLQLKGTQTIKSIKIEGNNNEILSGAAFITAYVDDLPPVITLTDATATSVTLDCADGVQLNESTATDFIIAVPPLLFSQGFKVTVTDSKMQTKSIETTKANTVLRSSMLVMPIIMFTESEIMEDKDDEEDELVIPAESISLSESKIKMFPTQIKSIYVTSYTPTDATEINPTYYSDSPSIAIVNQLGNITALSTGTAIITVIVGNTKAKCTVTVINMGTANIEYVDEYGVNHGYGIVLGEQVWAPVNCGYKKPKYDEMGNITDTGFPYGKLYQWGRKYGQGLGAPYDSGEIEITTGGVSLIGGQHSSNANKFYTNYQDNWLSNTDNSLWNSGTISEPHKTEYDPCPDGWRVPTSYELEDLAQNYSKVAISDDGIRGCFLSGLYDYSESSPQIFLPFTGCRSGSSGKLYDCDEEGVYWSNTPEKFNGYYSYNIAKLFIDEERCITSISSSANYAIGNPVRCVQE